MNLITKHSIELANICMNYHVRVLYVFGSVLTDKFNENSDIDVLVEFENVSLLDYFDNFMDFKEELEKLFHRKIDIVENQSVRNPVFRKILDREKHLVYERKSA